MGGITVLESIHLINSSNIIPAVKGELTRVECNQTMAKENRSAVHVTTHGLPQDSFFRNHVAFFL